MKFHSARCEVCGRYEFESDNVVAYRVRPDGPEIIDLHGEAPWSGIRCLCLACVEWIKKAPGMIGEAR